MEKMLLRSVAFLLVILALTGAGSVVLTNQPASFTSTSGSLIDHVVVIVMENKSLNSA
jgi:hypothetical protein